MFVHPACIHSISSTFTIWINRLLHSPNLVARGLPVEYEFEGILPKGPYLPCVSMAGGALLAGYHRIKAYNCLVVFTMWLGVHYWNNARSVNFHCISKATDVFLKQPRRQMLCKDTVKESREIVMLWKRGSMREMITKVYHSLRVRNSLWLCHKFDFFCGCIFVYPVWLMVRNKGLAKCDCADFITIMPWNWLT